MKKTLLIAPLVVLCLLLQRAQAATPYQVVDLRTKFDSIMSSNPQYAGTIGNAAIFLWTQPLGTYAEKTSLWRTDGTPEGTYPLRESSSRIYSYAALADGVYVGWYDSAGTTLWKTDGTVAGTTAVISSATLRYSPLGRIGQKLFLVGFPSREVVVQEGTETRSVTTFGSSASSWIGIGELGGAVLFATESGLWRSDGTASGTYAISNVPSSALITANDKVIFKGFTQESGWEFWTSDGTSAGTHILTDAEPGPASLLENATFARLGSKILFLSNTGIFGATDGTAAGTVVMRRGSNSPRPSFAVLGSNAFFPFDDGVHGREIWISDGTDAGTRMIADAWTDPGPSFDAITAGATHVYYLASDASHQCELYESDGTEAGTHPVYERGTPWKGAYAWSGFETIGDRVFFAADDGVNGREPWTTDGTDAGTHLIANLAGEIVGSTVPGGFFPAGGRMYFTGWSDDNVYKLWRTDGTIGGTAELFRSPDRAMLPRLEFFAGTTIYATEGYALHAISAADGTDVAMPQECTPGSPDAISSAGDKVFFANSNHLCASDGTLGGTSVLPISGGASRVATIAGKSYFLSPYERLLYTTDGTEGGTRVIARDPDATGLSSPLIPLAGALLYFDWVRDCTSSCVDVTRLCRFSGDAADSQVIAPVPTVSGNRTALDTDLLLFWTNASELWATDGTSAGTKKLRSFSPAGVAAIQNDRDRAFFMMWSQSTGYELWVTDGTDARTTLLRTFGAQVDAGSLSVVRGVAYFYATDADHGSELWSSDGTPEGTALFADIEPGPESSLPSGFTAAGDLLYFSARTAANGTELWALPLDSTPAVSIADGRAREAEGRIDFQVTLTSASSSPVSVSCTTVDATAHAGTDYTATSGSLVFAAGETTKTLSVPLIDDSSYGGVRTFRVTITSSDVDVNRARALGIIDEDDLATDLGVSLAPGTSDASPAVVVRNLGPAPAHGIRFCTATPPFACSPACVAPFELRAGETASFNAAGDALAGRIVTIGSAEPDPDPSNNRVTYRATGSLPNVLISPMDPVAGTSGLLIVKTGESTWDRLVGFGSSNTSVVTVPESIIISGKQTTVLTTFGALAPGTATLSAWVSIYANYPSTLPVRVGATKADAEMFGPRVRVSGGGYPWMQGQDNLLFATVEGCTEDMVSPTGTVDFLEDGIVVGSATVVDQKATLVFRNPKRRLHTYSAKFRGDARFLPADAESSIQIYVGNQIAPPTLEPIAGTNNVRIIFAGTSGHVPGGTVAVEAWTGDNTSNRGPVTIDGPLQPYGAGSASVMATGLNQATDGLSIDYSGDDFFNNGSWAMPVVLRGDANGDGRLNTPDVWYLINYLFQGGSVPLRDSDCNGDGVVNVIDLFYVINYIFAGGGRPL